MEQEVKVVDEAELERLVNSNANHILEYEIKIGERPKLLKKAIDSEYQKGLIAIETTRGFYKPGSRKCYVGRPEIHDNRWPEVHIYRVDESSCYKIGRARSAYTHTLNSDCIFLKDASVDELYLVDERQAFVKGTTKACHALDLLGLFKRKVEFKECVNTFGYELSYVFPEDVDSFIEQRAKDKSQVRYF